MKVKGIMDESREYLKSDDKIKDAKNIMEKKRLFSLPVFEEGKFKGVASYKRIINSNIPFGAKITKAMFYPPKIEEDEDVINAANVLFENGVKAAPVYSKGKYRGLVSEKDFLKIVHKTRLKDRKIGELANNVIYLGKGDTIGDARALMRKESISCIPIIENDEFGNTELLGIVNYTDIMRNIRKKGKIGSHEFTTDKLPDYDVKVTAIMDKRPLKVGEDSKLEKVAKELLDKNMSYALITDEKGSIKGLVTTKDILELICSLREEEGVYVQISGSPEDEFEKAEMHKKIDDVVKKVGKSLGESEYLTIHIKRYKKEGGQTKYSIRTRFLTPIGLFVTRGHGWDFIDTIMKVLSRLEEKIMKEHKKWIDSKKPRRPL